MISLPSTCRTASPACRVAFPPPSTQTGISIIKVSNNFVFAAGFFTRDGRYSNEFISNYLDVYVKDAIKRVPGVGDVTIFGERKYAMRIWLDPVRLAARNLTATDVVNALLEQNVEDSRRPTRSAARELHTGIPGPSACGRPPQRPGPVRQHHSSRTAPTAWSN